MSHEMFSITEFDLREYLSKSDDINILVHSSYYNETRKGKCRCLLVYKRYTLRIDETFEDLNSQNHVTVLGLMEAVKHIKIQGVNVCIISGLHVGFKGAMMGKGAYVAEVNELVRLVKAQKNKIKSITIKDGMEEIRDIIGSNSFYSTSYNETI